MIISNNVDMITVTIFRLHAASIVAQRLCTRLVTERSWIQILPGAGLFSLLFLSLYLSVSFSGVSLIRSLTEV